MWIFIFGYKSLKILNVWSFVSALIIVLSSYEQEIWSNDKNTLDI